MSQSDLIILEKAIHKLKHGFDSFPDTLNDTNQKKIEGIILKVAERLKNNYPYFQPNYAGQMLKPPHAVARLAYMLSLYINPNNHALDGGRESSIMEKEVICKIAGMFGWPVSLGHLTSGGTFANLEALWVAGKVNPNQKIVASQLAHYTHQRISSVLGLPFEQVECDQSGKIDLLSLEKMLAKRDVGTVVVTFGTTGIGSIDPLCEILELQKKYFFRIHIDAAYGGYYILADNLSSNTFKHYNSMSEADSIVIDPHKHGLQPYGCGCILFKNPEVGKFYKHDSPYTYFSSEDLHLGEISLECSRAGASAVGLWATMEMMPLVKNGDFSRNLEKSRQAALKLYHHIQGSIEFVPLLKPELDIVVWVAKAATLSEMSNISNNIFHLADKKYNLHLALINYPTKLLNSDFDFVSKDAEYVTCLRSCLMKPEHLGFVDELWGIVIRCRKEIGHLKK